MAILVVLALLFVPYQAGDEAKFARLAAEFDARDATLRRAASENSRAVAALDWIHALRAVADTASELPRDGAHMAWVNAHEAILAYDEIGGRWRIDDRVLKQIYERHAKSAVADELAWQIVRNGLSGECEGYVPCYAATLNMLYGEYLRRQPRGIHRDEAFERIEETLTIVVDDLLKRKERRDYLSLPEDCGDLQAGLRPLRAAVTGAGGGQRAAIIMIDQLLALCAKAH